ncbi:hypothetical protein A1Q2_06548 [Trichosporon asahii var. asahii CBS 8904]|uniref:Glucose-methanol-choline oxidoreductase N-terminal domain-containing protein n=2 Tax=Trichosporon asahii var. asahii TaxID=189963 RepID=K1V5D9_TRIAC|nr:hypothetical protein A1Q1_02563 [Trichosporon asahii var. asahii CBS 2479]EJT48431.1 hypothetical protein A1Q1_02563 [Trichosporon asahii var. asahii CBS 2479]EKC99144.1 hypothetical protein A1Q2_06548 [Trichosporon asahii var. asahii CBS 8904]
MLALLLLAELACGLSLGLFDKTYDYVIVGGGTAGLTLAARLSEDPSISVGVIEPGTTYKLSNPIVSDTPLTGALFSGSDLFDTNPLVDWNLKTEPLKGGDNRVVHYARGKCLGGTSARNLMLYQRPDKGSLDMWADVVGDESYRWDAFEPFFKKSVQFTPPPNEERGNASAQFDAGDFDPNGGPLSVTYPPYAQPMSSWMIPGMQQSLNIPEIPGFSGGNLMGSSWASLTVQKENGKRESSASAFLDPIRWGRSNLHVHELSSVRKILFDDQKNAIGVELKLGTKINARKEVILSAGAFHSPQILMLSGVGPAAHLQERNIPVVADRPGVGQNLTDHVLAGPSYRITVDSLTRLALNPLIAVNEFLLNFSRNKGILTNNGADVIAFEKIPRDQLQASTLSILDRYPESWPDAEYVSAPAYVGDFGALLLDQPRDGYMYGTLMAAVANPQSRGSVTLRSNRIEDKPVIEAGWLTHPADIDVMVASYKRARAVFTSDAVKGILADPVEYHPGLDVKTDEQILAAIRKDVMCVWHAAVSCRMGRRDDPTAVVDNKAKVIGVNRLRVVDASSFALLPPGHPQSVVYAFAEKIAADILAGH